MQQAAAARALSQLSGSAGDAGCTAIAAAGGVAVLVQALRRGSSAAVQQHALTALYHLAQASIEQRDAVAATGVIPALVQLLAQHGAVGEAAVTLLYALTTDDGAKERCAAIAAAGGIPALVSVLQSGTAGARSSAAVALGNMGCEASGLSAPIVAAGAVAPLVALLTHGNDTQQADAAAAIANLCAAAEGRAAAMEAGALQPLAELLRSSDIISQQQAVWAVQNLLYNEPLAQQAFLKQPGALNSLIGLLSSGGGGSMSSRAAHSYSSAVGEVQASACGALHNLACGGAQACERLLAAGAAQPLLQLMVCDSSECAVDSALATVKHWLRVPAHRPVLLDAGLLPALQHVQQRSGRPDARRLASAMLSALSTSATRDSGEWAASTGGTQPSAARMAALGSTADETASRPASSADAAAASVAAAPSASAPDVPKASNHLPPPARPPAPRICAASGCGATSGQRRCGGCGTVRYCSAACSKAHWRAHKAECRRLQAQQASAAAAAAAAGRQEQDA